MAIALVAHTKVASLTGSGNITTPAIDTTGATLLIVTAGYFGAVGTISDSKGNTWTALTQRGPGNHHQKLFYATNVIVGSGHTFTQTSGNNFPSIAVAAFSGTDTTAPFDVENGTGVDGSGTPTAQGGSVTPSQANSLVISAAQVAGVTNTPTIDSGFSLADSATWNSGISEGSWLFYLIQTSIVAENPTWTIDATPWSWDIENAVFKPGVAPLNIAIPLATLTITTYAPAVTSGIPIPVGSLAFTTFAPAVTKSIPIPAGSLAFTTYAPTLGTIIAIEVPTAILVITGYAPAMTVSIPIPVTTLTITGHAPILGILQIVVPAASMTLTTYAPSVGGITVIEVPTGHLVLTGYAPTVFQGNIGPCDDRFGPKIYFWEPSYLDRPEDTFLRATDWDAAGYEGMKFVQGLIIEADTEGQTREILLQGDQTDIETITINHNGQLEKPYSLNQPVLKHLLRLLPTDSTFWRLFNVRWVYEPAPEYAREWKTQGTDHDIPGFQFLKDGYIAHASTADITMNVTVDDTVFTYTIPHSSGEYVKTYLIFGIHPSGRTTKGTLYTYELTSSEPFQLYQKDCEVRVHDWSKGEYVVKQPFGDISRVYGARI